MIIGDLVKYQSPAPAGDIGLGLILDQPREGSSTVLWEKDQLIMTTWDAWLEVIDESR
jgi:hypothetical protein